MRPVHIYLAGASCELARVRYWARRIEGEPLLHLACRWWEQAHIGLDEFLSREEQQLQARINMRALSESAMVWGLWQDYSRGLPFELGFASGFGRTNRPHSLSSPLGPRWVGVSGADAHKTMFTAMLSFRDPSDEVAWCEVLRVARQIAGGE